MGQIFHLLTIRGDEFKVGRNCAEIQGYRTKNGPFQYYDVIDPYDKEGITYRIFDFAEIRFEEE